ncbi:MAG: homoserine O-acetyltransferase [Bacteroidia bacterium]|nr:homoserine O-acetyltransferase [Bacteroidia bacterium]
MSETLFHYPGPFQLESGATLPGFHLAYTAYGSLNDTKSNVVWICHALTANCHPEEWWPGLVGPGKLIDPAKHFIVCANMLGSCYGSTYALSTNPETGSPWYHDFPLVTNRDIARSFDLLREFLGVDRIHLGIGGSLGGQQLLEWAIMKPGVLHHLAPIATNAQHSPWGIAFNESQRLAIEADITWRESHPDAGKTGLRAARSIALLSYRSYDAYHQTQQEPDSGKLSDFRATSYQQYQGDKLVNRFDAFAYWTLSKAMDSHNLGRGRGGVEQALAQIKAKTLAIAVDSDGLFPPSEQKLLAQHIPGAQYAEFSSPFGHDGFLIEFDAIAEAISKFMS